MARDPDDDITLSLDFGDETLNDPNYEQNAGNDDNVTTTSTTPADGAPSATTQEGNAPVDDKSASGTGGGAQPPDTAGQRTRDGAVKADKDGNLVDTRGNIVATAGAERRYYEQSRRQVREIQRLETELATAKQQGSSTAALNGMPAQLGLSPQETTLGLNIVSSFKRDPVQAARFVLQEAMKLGHNLHQIVGTNGTGQVDSGSLNLQAVRDMIHSAVQPLIGDRTAQQQQLEVQQTAQREYNTFLAKHDNAAVHEDILGRVLQDHPDMSPEVAYWQLVAYAARNGLDFAQPLAPQVEARTNGNRQQPPATNGSYARPSPAQQQRHDMTMPNGGAPTADMRTGPDMAHPDDSWDSIVQGSLMEAGFTR